MVEIIEGRYYKTRDGRKVGPMKRKSSGWVADNGRIDEEDHFDWHIEGNYNWMKNDDPLDLIEEYKDDTQMFKVGDRVCNKDREKFFNGGEVATIVRTEGGLHRLDTGFWNRPERLDLAEETPSSPVQSRKTLVPGVYGQVSIVCNGDGTNVGIALFKERKAMSWCNLSTQELRDAIRVLGEVADYLEEVK